MKQLLISAVSLFIATFVFCYYVARTGLGMKQAQQEIYSYHNESIGFSDIGQLYVADTSKVKRSFFKRSPRLLKAFISCHISKTTLADYGDSLSAAFQISQPEVRIENSQGSLDAGSYENEITRPVFVTLLKDGRIKTLRWDTSLSVASASLLKEILSKFQFGISGVDSKDWTVQEADNVGVFQAGYHFVRKNGNCIFYEKQNNGYLHDPRHSYERITPEGKDTIYADSSHHILREMASETLTTSIGGDTVSISGSRIDIELLSRRRAGEHFLSLYRQLETAPGYGSYSKLGEKFTDRQIQDMAYENTLGQDDLATLLDQLPQTNNLTSENKEHLVMKFRALASLHPDDCRKIGSVLENERFGTPAFDVLSSALCRTGTPVATDVMAKIIEHRMNEKKIIFEFLPILATTTAPTAEAVSVSLRLGFSPNPDPNIISTAQLALGGLAYNLRATDDKFATSVVHFLLNKMKNDKDTVQELLVLGNTGSPEVLPVLQSFLRSEHTSTEVLVRSILALKLIDSDTVTSILNGLKEHKNPAITKAIDQTLEFRKNLRPQ